MPPIPETPADPNHQALTATAIVAAISNGAASHRHESCPPRMWLVLKQHSTGGEARLSGMSKRGNCLCVKADPWRAFARLQATHSAPPTASTAANKWPARSTDQAKSATQHPSATPTGCPLNRLGWTPKDGLACLYATLAQATMARSVPTAHRSTTRIVSCSARSSTKLSLKQKNQP